MTDITKYFIREKPKRKTKRELTERIETKKVHKENVIVKKIKDLETHGKTVKDFRKTNGMLLL